MGGNIDWEKRRRLDEARERAEHDPPTRNVKKYAVPEKSRGMGGKWYQHPPRKDRITLPTLKFMRDPSDESARSQEPSSSRSSADPETE
jgi:hypothetical protein